MLAAALLASLLAQAEPAPPSGPAEPAPPASAPGPAEQAPPPAAPGPAPVAPAPAAPAPAATAPAAAPPPPLVAEPAPPPANSVSVHVRYAYRLGSDGDSVVPAAGFSLGGEFEHRLVGFRNGIEIGAATNFFYDRFSKDVVVSSVGSTGTLESSVGTRTLSQTSFALLETTGWRYADMRLFVGLGGGLSVGYFASPDMSSNSLTDLLLLARGVFGFDFAIAARTAAILRVDYSHTFARSVYLATPMQSSLTPLFGDLFDAGIGLLVRF